MILFINACMREQSRTKVLADAYLSKQTETIETVNVSALKLEPFDEAMLAQRNQDIDARDFTKYPLAKQFAQADKIVIAAPYWDCSFPSKLKIYIEHICINKLTFGHQPDGSPAKLCRADEIVYLTTCGGFLPKTCSVKLQLEELAEMFAIPSVKFYCAQALDVFPEKVQSILAETIKQFE